MAEVKILLTTGTARTVAIIWRNHTFYTMIIDPKEYVTNNDRSLDKVAL